MWAFLDAVSASIAALDFGRAAQDGPIAYHGVRDRPLASIRLALDALTTPKKIQGNLEFRLLRAPVAVLKILARGFGVLVHRPRIDLIDRIPFDLQR